MPPKKPITIAFDIDGTLRCNCTETCRDRNIRICELLIILRSFKNTRIVAWSGGGREYTQSAIRFLGLSPFVSDARCFGKVEYLAKYPKPDIAIDDQQEFNLATFNLIVREK